MQLTLTNPELCFSFCFLQSKSHLKEKMRFAKALPWGSLWQNSPSIPWSLPCLSSVWEPGVLHPTGSSSSCSQGSGQGGKTITLADAPVHHPHPPATCPLSCWLPHPRARRPMRRWDGWHHWVSGRETAIWSRFCHQLTRWSEVDNLPLRSWFPHQCNGDGSQISVLELKAANHWSVPLWGAY